MNKQVTGLRRLLYLVSPNETSFEKLEEVPQYVEEVKLFLCVCVKAGHSVSSIMMLKKFKLTKLHKYD